MKKDTSRLIAGFFGATIIATGCPGASMYGAGGDNATLGTHCLPSQRQRPSAEICTGCWAGGGCITACASCAHANRPSSEFPETIQMTYERRFRSGVLKAIEVLGGVTVEVEVELGDAALQHAPHRLAKIRHELHHPQRRDGGGARLSEVRGEQV